MPQLTIQQKIKEILEVYEKVCTEWECEFMESVKNQKKFSEKQEAVINRIYVKVCESPY